MHQHTRTETSNLNSWLRGNSSSQSLTVNDLSVCFKVTAPSFSHLSAWMLNPPLRLHNISSLSIPLNKAIYCCTKANLYILIKGLAAYYRLTRGMWQVRHYSFVSLLSSEQNSILFKSVFSYLSLLNTANISPETLKRERDFHLFFVSHPWEWSGAFHIRLEDRKMGIVVWAGGNRCIPGKKWCETEDKVKSPSREITLVSTLPLCCGFGLMSLWYGFVG